MKLLGFGAREFLLSWLLNGLLHWLSFCLFVAGCVTCVEGNSLGRIAYKNVNELLKITTFFELSSVFDYFR